MKKVVAPASDDPKNLVCAPGAIIRRKVGDVQYEYTIDEAKCNGCGKCAEVCPVEAMALVSAGDPHKPKRKKAKARLTKVRNPQRGARR